MARQFYGRKRNVTKPEKIIRIYTEGTKTEPNYFHAIRSELRLKNIDIRVVGCGDHTVPLVEFVLSEKKQAETAKEEDTEWWAVFDKDSFGDFNKAIALAESNGINAAYSNESFELWFVLHFEFLSTSLGRDRFPEKLTKHLGRKYEKSDSKIYEVIKDLEHVAVRNAKKLEKDHSDAGIQSYSHRDPSTTVYKLVERLRGLKIIKIP